MRPERVFLEGTRAGNALRYPKMPLVGDLTFYPTLARGGQPGEHRCILIAMREQMLFLAPICTFDKPTKQDASCLFVPSDIPDGELTAARSFVDYYDIKSDTHENYQRLLKDGIARYLTYLKSGPLARALEGLRTTETMEVTRREEIFGPTRSERFDGLRGSTSVLVENRHLGPRRLSAQTPIRS